MTPSKSTPTNVVVVDGSNIATEGRSMPSLAQLNEAVTAFTEEFPDAIVTVVVDATFGHRIDKKELAEFDEAVAHNELVAPPAGAIGRGDAFVLSIANKVGARILSNDSFQEFHGEYPWLFDEGRLIGGKPVPFVGWVFVERLPVKGPVSRKATRAARGGGGGGRDSRPSRRQASKEASLPMPVPSAPPPGLRRHEKAAPARAAEPAPEPAPRPAPASGSPVNDLLPFLDFVEHHPVGSSVNGVVESYSSHGAYVEIGDVRGYVPLRLMGDPPPRSAREVMKLGDAVTLVVTSFAPGRRSIDLSIPKVAPAAEVAPSPALDEIAESVVPAKAPRKRAAKKGAAPVPEPVAAAVGEAVAEASLEALEPVAHEQPALPVLPVLPGIEPELEVAPAATKKAAARKAAAKRAPAKKAAATKKAAAKKAPAKKAAARRSAAAKQAAAEPVVAPPAPEPAPRVVEAEPTPPPAPAPRKRSAKKAAAAPVPAADGVAVDAAPVKRPPRKRTSAAAAAAPGPTGEGS